MNRKTWTKLGLVAVVIISVALLLFLSSKQTETVNSFAECVKAGNPVMESYPRQCRSEDGRLFVEDISDQPDQMAAAVGVVTAVDQSQIAADGPTNITIETETGEALIAVPSMGVNLCPAQENILDPGTLAVGDEIAVLGTLDVDGAIVPCESADHYLRFAEEVSRSEVTTLAAEEREEVLGLPIRFNEFVQDNRCSVDEECMEAGGVTVNVTLGAGADGETFNLASDEVPYTFSAYQVSIVGVQPVRRLGEEIAQDEYQISFLIAR